MSSGSFALPHARLSGSGVRHALALGCLGALVGAGAAIAATAAGRGSAIVFAGPGGTPAWMAGPLAGVGIDVTAAQFWIVLGVMAGAYLGVLALGQAFELRWVVGAVVVLHSVLLLAPPLLSSDVFSYIDYARLGGVHGLDPYAVAPSAAPHEAIYHYVRWRSVPSAYGPLFTLGSYPLGHLSPAGALWAFKGLAAAASLGCVALVWRIATVLGRPAARAVAIFGLNPLLLVWTVGGAHNDVLMLALLLAGVLLTLSARDGLGGGAVVAAGAVKASALVAAPFLVLGARRPLRAAAGVAAGAVILVTVSLLAFRDHAAGLVEVLSHDRRLVAFDGVPNELAHLVGLAGMTAPVRTACTVALLAVLVLLVVRVLRGVDWIAACGWAFVAVVASSSWFLAWYTVWPLPLAALTRDRRLLVATLALQAYFAVNHMPPVLS